MRSFSNILKESETNNLEVEDYQLSYEGRQENKPWFLDRKAKYDIRQKSINAEKFWQNNYNNYEVQTSDGYTIHFTKTGRKEFFTSIQGAFFDGPPGAAAHKVKKYWPLANELIKTINVLGDLVKKSKLVDEQPNQKKEKKPDVDHYETFLTQVVINGKIRQMKIKVEVKKPHLEKGNIKRNYYYHWLQEQKQNKYIVRISSFQFLE